MATRSPKRVTEPHECWVASGLAARRNSKNTLQSSPVQVFLRDAWGVGRTVLCGACSVRGAGPRVGHSQGHPLHAQQHAHSSGAVRQAAARDLGTNILHGSHRSRATAPSGLPPCAGKGSGGGGGVNVQGSAPAAGRSSSRRRVHVLAVRGAAAVHAARGRGLCPAGTGAWRGGGAGLLRTQLFWSLRTG
eukprot:SAG31_NODE_1788_length_7267_cov_6.640067_5_plen_190_part_00